MNLEKKRKKLVQKLTNKEYRDAWGAESIKMTLPYQIQAIRTQRDWSQALLGVKAEMKQNAVSRLESMDYGNLSINTLLRLASAFDCGLLVKFVPFSRLVKEFEDVSVEALKVDAFEDDLHRLNTFANDFSLSEVGGIGTRILDSDNDLRTRNMTGDESPLGINLDDFFDQPHGELITVSLEIQ